MGPMSSSGRIIGQGNLAEAKAMLKKAGNAIATSQRMVFHFSRFFFSGFSYSFAFFRCGWFGSLQSPTPEDCSRDARRYMGSEAGQS